MRTKVTLVLVFLNVALFFFIFKFERTWRTEAASREARRRVLGPETADIRSLEVTSANAGGPAYALARQRDAWHLTKPLHWPAHEHAVSRIVNELQLLEHETQFPTAELGQNGKPTLADYGLEKPKLTLAFTSGESGTRTELRIGDTTNVGNRLYLLSPDGERIHVVSRTLVDSLTLPLEQLRADTLLTVPVFEARSLSVQTSAPDQARAGGSASLRTRIRREGSRWTFETPIIAHASKLAVDTTISQLNALKPRTFNPPPPATLPSAAPSIRITLEGNSRHETLFLGDPVKPATGAAPGAASPEIEYYAQLDGRNALFTVAVGSELVDTLRNAQAKLRERRILDFEPRNVVAVTLAAPVQGAQTLTLQRIEASTGATSGWQLVRRSGPDQPPQNQPADTALVQRLLEDLALLSAKSFESDFPTPADLENWGFNRPEREVTLTLAPNAAGVTPPPVVLQLGTDARREVFARVGTSADAGPSVYAVESEILRQVPTEPLAWRSRTVFELPESARIAAIKIIDLATNAAAFETKFDAAGEPEAGRAAAAAKQLATSLRKLQVRRFVRDRFDEQPAIAGEERPWRYRLEATISLPGGLGLEQTSTFALQLTERVGGSLQVAGSRELDSVFELDQPTVDALWSVLYGPRDPGPPAGK